MTPLLDVNQLNMLFPMGRLPLWRRLTTHARKNVEPSFLHAVSDFSFQMQPGESVGLVGESGCGKSTLVNLLSRLTDPTSGSIRFQGRELSLIPARKFGKREERAKIQVVFQDPHDSLNPRHTAFQAIAEPLKRIRDMKSGIELTNMVEKIADDVGLPAALLLRYPHQLSGGQKARVNIARAIALEPTLLILDEPTSALDVSVQAVILQLLDKLRHEFGMSYIFVSHDLNVVRLLCDRVVVMYLGKIVEMGPTGEILREPKHPYTQALISAIPNVGAKSVERIWLSGEPRSPIDPDPNVCRFYGRCPKQKDICREALPKLRSIDDKDHVIACHFDDENLQS
jgi:oligopeptide/dipeptide ABC transporter ATP-binding protein